MKERTRWTEPPEIAARLRRIWERGDLLTQRRWPDASLFPWQHKLRAPDARGLREDWGAIRQWIQRLENGSRAARGFGYEIVWTEVNHRQLGRNRLPSSIVVANLADALALLDVTEEEQRYHALVTHILGSFPELEAWFRQNPFLVLQHEAEWSRVILVLHWFRAHPRPGVYVRQLEIAGVDTKFIETNRGLLAALLDRVLPSDAVLSDAHPIRQFELRYGLRAEQPLVRFRILDPDRCLSTLDDIATPAPQFARLDLPVSHVFITENKTNGLAFPECRNSIVVFGLGNGILRLTEIPWLKNTIVHYWGDIDTHGFAILSRLRAYLPHAQSFLMDRETLQLHEPLWTHESTQHTGELEHLTEHERALYDALKANLWGSGVRLEQERIAYAWVRQALAAITR